MNNVYYTVKPYLPRDWQIYMRRLVARKKWKQFSDVWPILREAGRVPTGWPGWPEGKQFGYFLTHDVETHRGHNKVLQLMEFEKVRGLRSSFNFVPERYKVSPALREELTSNGFEVGVHGLYHDGKLYKSKKIFMDRAVKINRYLREWESTGFRSPAMHHNLDWIRHLDIQYDLSTFDTDPFEPQSDGVGTIFPFIVPGTETRPGYVEMPYTLVQDFTLFIILEQPDTRIWKEKIDWIVSKGGMVLVNVHPDYINFNGKSTSEEYPIGFYEDMVNYIESKYSGLYWHVLPREAAGYIRKCNTLVKIQNVYNYMLMNTFKEVSRLKKGMARIEPVTRFFKTSRQASK